jgi:hypothetical protein
MNENHPFENMYEKIEELIRFAKEKALQPIDSLKIPLDINERLEKIERDIEKFHHLTKDIVNLSGVSKEEIESRLSGRSEEISDEGSYLLKKGHKLRQEVEALQESLGKPVESEPKQAAASVPAKPADEKKSRQKRKSKFKRFGSDKNWKPL